MTAEVRADRTRIGVAVRIPRRLESFVEVDAVHVLRVLELLAENLAPSEGASEGVAPTRPVFLDACGPVRSYDEHTVWRDAIDEASRLGPDVLICVDSA